MGGYQAKLMTMAEIIDTLKNMNGLLVQNDRNTIVNLANEMARSLEEINKQYILVQFLKDKKVQLDGHISQLTAKMEHFVNIFDRISKGESIAIVQADKQKYKSIAQFLEFYKANLHRIKTFFNKCVMHFDKAEHKEGFWNMLTVSLDQAIKQEATILRLKQQNQRQAKQKKQNERKYLQINGHNKLFSEIFNEVQKLTMDRKSLKIQNQLLQQQIIHINNQFKKKMSINENSNIKDKKISQLETEPTQKKSSNSDTQKNSNLSTDKQQIDKLSKKITEYEQIVQAMQDQIFQSKQHLPLLRMERCMSEHDNNKIVDVYQVQRFINNCKKIFKIPSKFGSDCSLVDLQPKIEQAVDNCKKYEDFINETFEILYLKFRQHENGISQKFERYQDFSFYQKKFFINTILLDDSKVTIIPSQIENLRLTQPQSKIQDKTMMFQNRQKEQFVVKQLKRYLKNEQVKRFSLLYRSGQGGNISQIIQKHPNTLILVLTKSGCTVAGYSSLSYCETVDLPKSKGLLISTYSRSVCNLKQGHKAVQDNSQWIIFGKGMIKISKKNTDKLTMAFNLASTSSFIMKSCNFEQFVGESDTQIQIKGYEIYQIILKNVQPVNLQPRKTSSQMSKRQSLSEQRTKSLNEDSIKQEKEQNIKLMGMQKQLQNIKNTIKQYEMQIKSLTTQNKQLKQKLEDGKERLQQQEEQKQKNKQLNIQNMKATYEQVIKNKDDSIQQQKNRIKELQNQIKKSESRERQKSEKLKFQTLQNEKIVMKQQLIRIKKEADDRQNMIRQMQQNIKSMIQYQSKSKQLATQESIKQVRQKGMNTEKQIPKRNHTQPTQTQAQTQTKQQLRQQGMIPLSYMFDGTSLQLKDADKQFLLCEVSKLQNNFKNVRTRILYKYPLMRECDLHQCIDSKANYIVIIKIKKQKYQKQNMTLVLYSEKPLNRDQEGTNGTNMNKCFIGSLTNKKIFCPKNNNKATVTTYDRKAIIFGTEIIMNNNSHGVHIQTNIGTNYRVFDTGKYDNEFFIGNSGNLSEVQSYEVYQIMFQ